MRTRLLRCLQFGWLLLPSVGLTGAETPSLAEVLGLVREHLVGVSAAEVDQAALKGLLDQLSPRVQFVDEEPVNPSAAAEAERLGAVGRPGQRFGYLQLKALENGAATAIHDRLTGWAEGTPVEGLILDLRFAGGSDFAEVVRVASEFLAEPVPLLDWGEGVREAVPVDAGFRGPLLVLINAGTTGAAEALAAVLQRTERALTIGASTAGLAVVYGAYPLSSGGRLRIATGLVKLGDGSSFPATGVPADLKIEVPAGIEKANMAAFARTLAETAVADAGKATEPGRSGGEGESADGPPRAKPPGPSSAMTPSDPCLARGLDLLTGLAVVRHREAP
ncbi:MAG: hypothetical protein H7A45_09420 [Verrucomicrobiales bacterium]|nr:hypothetical protein [Verrucomicrobiales bacterium]MCP5526228.1 hypothetical protein [Verrucomicrobiales bacterium]